MTTLLTIIITINSKSPTPSSSLHLLHLLINSPPLSASIILICVKYFRGQVVFLQKITLHHLIINSSPLSDSTILVIPLPISFSCHGSSVAYFELEIWLEGKVEHRREWQSIAKTLDQLPSLSSLHFCTLADLLEMFETVWVPVSAGPQLQECGFSPLLVEH